MVQERQLPASFTLQSGETVPVTWTESVRFVVGKDEFGFDIEVFYSFPILPTSVMNQQNVRGLMEQVYGFIWDNVTIEQAMGATAFASLATERMNISGLTVDQLEADPGLMANLTTVARQFTQGQFAPTAQQPIQQRPTPVRGVTPPEEQAVPFWTLFSPEARRAYIEQQKAKVAAGDTTGVSPRLLKAIEAGFLTGAEYEAAIRPGVTGIAEGGDISGIRGDISVTSSGEFQAGGAPFQEAARASLLATQEHKAGRKEAKELKLKQQQEKEFRRLTEVARLAGQRRQPTAGI